MSRTAKIILTLGTLFVVAVILLTQRLARGRADAPSGVKPDILRFEGFYLKVHPNYYHLPPEFDSPDPQGSREANAASFVAHFPDMVSKKRNRSYYASTMALSSNTPRAERNNEWIVIAIDQRHRSIIDGSFSLSKGYLGLARRMMERGSRECLDVFRKHLFLHELECLPRQSIPGLGDAFFVDALPPNTTLLLRCSDVYLNYANCHLEYRRPEGFVVKITFDRRLFNQYRSIKSRVDQFLNSHITVKEADHAADVESS